MFTRCHLHAFRAIRASVAGAMLLAGGLTSANASTVLYRDDADLVRLSDRVVHGRVLSVRTERRNGAVYTVAHLAVIEDFTGGRDAEIDVYELGGTFDSTRLFVTGAATFDVGSDVIVCLERFGSGLYRNVAMSFSKFDVVRRADGIMAAIRQPGAVVVGQTASEPQMRTPDSFRRVVSTVKGSQSTTFAAPDVQSPPDVSSSGSGAVEFGEYTLLGSGIRWNQSESQAIDWYRNTDAPAPVTVGNSDSEILLALSAWTTPADSALNLNYAGTRSLGGQSPYCTSINEGVGLITYEDPTNEVGSGVLAIGGGCSTSAGAKTVNGQLFSSFTHAFVIFNTAAELGATYRTSTNFARVLTHELGHAIGLGHTPTSIAGATTNVMYPSCCYAATPIPPALGPDDLQGLAFIYPSGGSPSCSFTVSPTSSSVGSSQGQFVVSVTTSAECGWQASSQDAWLTLSAGSGTGSGSLLVTYSPNSGASRLGSVTVAGATVSVTQSQVSTPSSCAYSVSPSSVDVAAGGGTTTLSVSVTSGCQWTAASGANWIVVAGGQSGVGSGSVTVVVDANMGPARGGSLLVAGQTVTVGQAAGTTPCTYSVSPSALTSGSAGGAATLTLATGADCTWSANANDGWLAVTSASSGTGPATIGVAINANQGGQRAGGFTVAGQSISVDQTAATSSCSFSLQGSQTQFQAGGGTTSVSVMATQGCGWSAVGTAPWLSVTAGAQGTGNGVVTIAVGSNGGPSRTAALMVGGESLAIVQSATSVTDADLDGLPDSWEQRYGLDPTSSAGADGATGDPDGDGRSNLTEYQMDSHPLGRYVRYLAEGAATDFFSTLVAVANPGSAAANVLLRFQTDVGIAASALVVVPAGGQRSIVGGSLAALVGHAFSTVVESDELVVVDRRMEWDGAGYGGHAETSVESPSAEWYLAEGATHSGFELFYLLQNPGPIAADVEITYLLPSPQVPLVKTYTVAPSSRFNVWINHEDARLSNTDVSAVVRVFNDVPIIVERSMYLNTSGRVFGAGHNSAAVRAPATEWFLAEGATGPYFDTFVLIANPSQSSASAVGRYLLPNGTVVTRNYTIPALSRRTIWVDHETAALADTAFSLDLRVTNGVGVIVERSMWWPGTASTWQDAHNALGVNQSHAAWAVADGETGGARQTDTYLLVANTGSTPTEVRVTLLPEAQSPIARTFTVAPQSRFNVDVRAYFPQVVGQRYGATIEALTPGGAIVVERALYWDAHGSHWAAGAASWAMPLP